MITGQEQPDAGALHDRRDGGAGLRGPEPRDAGRREERCGRRSPAARTTSSWASGKMNSRAYVASFNFLGTDQQKKVGMLSGGERNRVHLAKMLTQRRQRAAAGRADQRPGREHAARAGGGAGELRRLRRGRQPRPLVPGPHLPRTSWPSRATARCAGSRATGRTTRRTGRSGWGWMRSSRTGSSIGV